MDELGFDFDAAVQAPFRMQPGLRRLAAGAVQLTPSVAPMRGPARHLREKLAVLWRFRDQALCCAPGFDPRPALDALAAHAATEQPDAFAVDGGAWHARWLGWQLDADDTPVEHPGPGQSPWPEIGTLLRELPAHQRRPVLLSLAFAEDFAIVNGSDGSIPWLSVALPSGWAPEDKVGLPFAAVHAPVADNRLVVGAAPHLVKLVTGPERWERFVWTIAPDPRLHAHPQRQPHPRWPAGLTADAAAATAWWRTERQTFLPIPALGQAVFTIGVQTTPLATAIDTPERAARLRDALATMSEAVLDYRGLAEVRAPLLAWLAHRAGR